MPYSRPTLSELRNQVAQDIASALPGSDALLRFSNLKITGEVQAFLANLHFGYLDWIAKQSTPFTATDEYLEAWAALKDVFRKSSTSAKGAVSFPGVPGTLMPINTVIVRGDGVTYKTTAAAAVNGVGIVAAQAVADEDQTGETGAFGDAPIGTAMTLGTAIAGIQSKGVVSTEFVGGADLESDESLRSRMLQKYQNPPQGGSKADYETWALEVPGVTRAWCFPTLNGPGTVGVYVMFDITRAAFDGFPQGSNGVAASDDRATPATGDQLLVANHIYENQPVTPVVRILAPTPHAINFSISGIDLQSQSAVNAAIDDVFDRLAKPGGTVPLNQINSAISSVPGAGDFLILSPLSDITNPAGSLPVRGTMTWS